MQTARNVDLNQYQGLWYEIALTPNAFQKNMLNTRMTYTLRDGFLYEYL